MASKRFTTNQMKTLVCKYGSDQKIADVLGVSRQNIQRQRKALEVNPYKRTINNRNSKIIRFRKAGWLIWELAEKFDLSQRQIIRILKEDNNENNN